MRSISNQVRSPWAGSAGAASERSRFEGTSAGATTLGQQQEAPHQRGSRPHPIGRDRARERWLQPGRRNRRRSSPKPGGSGGARPAGVPSAGGSGTVGVGPQPKNPFATYIDLYWVYTGGVGLGNRSGGSCASQAGSFGGQIAEEGLALSSRGNMHGDRSRQEVSHHGPSTKGPPFNLVDLRL